MKKLSTYFIVLLMAGLGLTISGCGDGGGGAARAGNMIMRRMMNRVFREFRRPFRQKKEKVGLPEQLITPGIEVLGMEPSWLASEKNCELYYFNLLTSLVVGEYDINPFSGNPRGFAEETMAQCLDSTFMLCAKEKRRDMQILILATMHGDYRLRSRGDINTANYRNFLKSTKAQDQFVENMADLVNARGWAEGVVLDFPYLPRGETTELIAFLRDLKTQMNRLYKEGNSPPRKIYLKVPPIDENESYAELIPLLAKEKLGELPLVDRFILRAYPGERSHINTPSWPQESTRREFGLDSIVAFFKAVDVNPIIEYPYMGYRRTRRGKSLMSYKQIMDSIPKREREDIEYFDEYAEFKISRNQAFRFEDSTTLSAKYKWVKDEKLGGISLWALGYSANDEKLWNAIGAELGETKRVLLYPTLGFGILFFVIGFWFANIRYWQVRNELARNRSLFFYFVSAMALLAVIAGWCMFWDFGSGGGGAGGGRSNRHYIALGLIVLVLLLPVSRKAISIVRRLI